MPEVTLAAPPALAPLLVRGAVRSPFRRPHPDAAFPRERLVLPGVRVDAARLARYERVCGFPTGAEALPVTYPHVLAFPLAMRLMSARAFPLPLLGLVHTSISLARHRPLPVGGEYELAVHVAGLAAHRRGTEATVVTEARWGGAVVWESTSTYLARHGGESERRSVEPVDPLPVRDEWGLGADVGRRYASVSEDRNPIHLTSVTARLFGFRRTVAHGMWTAARCLAAFGEVERVRVEFRAPVLLPGRVEYGASDEGFELRSDGRVHLVGTVRGW
ncbi:MaoC/PaaZ C-terminal domain-containing protein [Streptomyces sp. NPDC096205]|uniref:MaoC/PaaZ C-terminal domain-containing protein n=1 Tax=Streptomyces sp. NPDC096205 TaxID=3366081 RepID=UPI0037F20373